MVGCRGPAPADPGYSKERRRRRRTVDVAKVDFVRHIVKITVDFVGFVALNRARRLRIDAHIDNIVAVKMHGVSVIYDDFRLCNCLFFVAFSSV